MAGSHCNGLVIFANLICILLVISEASEQEVSVQQTPNQIYAISGSPSVLPCGVDISDAQYVESWWLKDGGRIENTTRTKYSNLDLHVGSVLASDQGVYRCFVRLPAGVVFGPVTRVSIVSLDINSSNASVEGVLSQNVVLHCGINSVPPESTEWGWKKGQEVVTNPRYKILKSGNLLIKDLEAADAGTFLCTALNYVLRSEQQSVVHLAVRSSSSRFGPEILDTFGRRLRLTDNSTTLVCVPNGSPHPSLQWVLSFEIDNEVQSHVISTQTEISLNSQSVTGNYSCLATNGAQHAVKSVYAFNEPSFPDLPPISSYPAAKTVRFECKSSIAPTFWYKDGELLPTNKGRIKKKNNELVISNTIQSDSGFYQCESGERIATGRLIVLTSAREPDAPVQVICAPVSSRSISVHWELPSSGDVLAFSVHYMPVEGGEERQHVSTSRTSTSWTAQNLLPNTNYSLYVRSYSGRSASGQSERVYCTTLEDYPSSTPKFLNVRQLGPSTQYRLRWKQLTNEEARGNILLYKLQWRTENGNFSNVQYLHGASHEFTITGLQSSTNYFVRLLPATNAGFVPQANEFPWTKIQTGPQSTNLSFHPPSARILFVNSSTVMLAWAADFLPAGQELRGFRVCLGEYTHHFGEMVYHPTLERDANTLDFIYAGLAPATQYEFRIQSYTEEWESELAFKFVKTANDSNIPLNGQDLATVIGLEGIPRSSSEIELRWSRPHEQTVDHYVIRYNSLNSGDNTVVESQTEERIIGGLAPYTTYEFVVGYQSSGFAAPFSRKIEAMTMEGKPGPPSSPSYQVLNKTSIQVTWKEPVKPNGKILRYVIEFTNTTGAVKFFDSNDSALTYVITSLQPNTEYSFRVAAVTSAGSGTFSAAVNPKIFSNAADRSENSGMVQDSPGTGSGSFFPGTSQQQLGLIFGTVLGLISISICSAILIWRNRCFAMITRTSHLNDRGAVGKDTVDSATIEMKVFGPSGDVLDTKGRHANANGTIHEVCEPLLDGDGDGRGAEITRNCNANTNAARRREADLEGGPRGNS